MTPFAAMPVPSAQSAVRQVHSGACRVRHAAPANAGRVALAVESIGHLVPRPDFSGRVHSVFAQACNLACEGMLLTLCAAGIGDGPATLRLARGAPGDLRKLFDVGERIHCRHGRAPTRRAELRLLDASVWRPAEPGSSLPPPRIRTHLLNARLRLAHGRGIHASVVDGEAAPVAAALRDACQALDGEQAARHVDRLIGWGEGLTPAGDDFLIGLIAGLDALAQDDEGRRRFHSDLAALLCAGAQRTTPIAAHYLRLAAAGHYTEPLLLLRTALLCEDDGVAVDAALQRALAVGATSGADTVSGLLAGLFAWSPAAPTAAAA